MFDICVTIVYTYEKEYIETALKTLYADLKDTGLKFCVVLVDNNSGDNVERFEQTFENFRVIKREKNWGFGASHNLAMVSVPNTKYYFVLNCDIVFPENQKMLKRLYNFMEENPRVGISGPKLYYPNGTLQYSCCRFPTFMQPLYSRTKYGQTQKGKIISDRFHMKDFDHNKTIVVDWIIGSAMFVRKKAIDAVGIFDERFWMYAEDCDWCKRMWEHGWSVYYVHDVHMFHSHNRFSARVPGVLRALITNRYARVHIASWLKYFYKWRGNQKYYEL